MNTRFLLALLIFLSSGCNKDQRQVADSEPSEALNEMVFNQEKWKTKEWKNYPYRDNIVNDVLYNDTVRSLKKVQVLELLGEPDRINENYLYYLIDQKRLFSWPLHTKTLVFKFAEDSSTIEWIKVHE